MSPPRPFAGGQGRRKRPWRSWHCVSTPHLKHWCVTNTVLVTNLKYNTVCCYEEKKAPSQTKPIESLTHFSLSRQSKVLTHLLMQFCCFVSNWIHQSIDISFRMGRRVRQQHALKMNHRILLNKGSSCRHCVNTIDWASA